MFYVIIIILLLFPPTTMMRAAPQPKFPSTTMPQARVRSRSAQMYHFLNQIKYVLCYYNYSLIISSYHNDARSPSAQISLCHNDPGARAQPLGPKILLF